MQVGHRRWRLQRRHAQYVNAHVVIIAECSISDVAVPTASNDASITAVIEIMGQCCDQVGLGFFLHCIRTYTRRNEGLVLG